MHVAIYTINEEEKIDLDICESLGIGYEESAIDVPEFGYCFTYLANNTHIVDDLAPYCWYREMVLRGCQLLKFPEDYIASIKAITPLRDPDETRRRKNWELVETLRDGAEPYAAMSNDSHLLDRLHSK